MGKKKCVFGSRVVRVCRSHTYSKPTVEDNKPWTKDSRAAVQRRRRLSLRLFCRPLRMCIVLSCALCVYVFRRCADHTKTHTFPWMKKTTPMQIRAPLGKRGNVTIIKLKYIRSKCAEAESNKKKRMKKTNTSHACTFRCVGSFVICVDPQQYLFSLWLMHSCHSCLQPLAKPGRLLIFDAIPVFAGNLVVQRQSMHTTG